MNIVPLVFGACLFLSFHSANAELPSNLSQECLSFIKALPADVESDFISVPENWSRPLTSKKLQVFYYGTNLHAYLSVGITPIVYFNGGPGYSTHGASRYFRSFEPAKNVPFLYIDQRGTGCSGSYPEVPNSRAGAERLALYGTRAIVRDAEAIRARIFPNGEKWSLFGQSYGTAIVHRYVATDPQAIKKAFAHGLSMMTDGIQWVEDRMLAQKRVSQLYLSIHPEDEKIMMTARAELPINYCNGNATEKICGSGLLDSILSSLGFRSQWESVHQTVSKLFNADGKLDLTFLAQIIPNQVTTTTSMSAFMAASVATRELPGGLLEQWSCKHAVPALITQGENPDAWFHNECRTDLALVAAYGPFIESLAGEDYLSLSDLKRGLLKNANLELHLYSGELDTFSPREGCEEVVKLLGGRIQYTNFLQSGHDWINEPKIWADLKSAP